MGGSVALEIQDWTVEWVPLGELRCNDKNPRHNDAAVEHVAASWNRSGGSSLSWPGLMALLLRATHA